MSKENFNPGVDSEEIHKAWIANNQLLQTFAMIFL